MTELTRRSLLAGTMLATAHWYKTEVSMPNVDALNAGYVTLLLEQYLENPESVPEEWRSVFESGRSDVFASLPGLQRQSFWEHRTKTLMIATRRECHATFVP